MDAIATMLRFDGGPARYCADSDLIRFAGHDGYAPIGFAISPEALEELAGEPFAACPMALFARHRPLVFERARRAYLAGAFDPHIGIVLRAAA